MSRNSPLIRKTCNDAFNKILDCETDKDHTRGGSYTLDKGDYVIESYIHKGKLECAPKDQAYGLDAAEASDNIKEFCKRKKDKITERHEEWMRVFPKSGITSLNTLKIQWTNDSPGCGEGGAVFKNGYPVNEASTPFSNLALFLLTLKLSLSPTHESPSLTCRFQDACNRFFTNILSECKGNSNPWSVGGTLTDECAVYTLSVSPREALVCSTDPDYSPADRDHLDTFDRGRALDAIDDFCSKDLLADPKARVKDTGFSQDGTWPQGVAKGGKNGISIDVSFESDTCDKDTPKAEKFKTGGPECKRKLSDLVLDGCDTTTRQKKMGGSLLESVSGPL